MSTLSREKINDADLAVALSSLPGWRIQNGAIQKVFEFDSYAHGVLFVAALAHLAEQLDHHPDITLTYRKVEVSTSTHSSGGITAYDLELARTADGLLA